MKGIYKFENKINGKIYIGQSINIEKRYKEHFYAHTNPNDKGYNTKFYRALRKYGSENFTFEIIEKDIEDLNSREEYWVQYYNSYKAGYNSNLGGDKVTENNENHPNAKLKNLQILEIKQYLLETRISQYELAKRYGLTQSEISQINTGHKWGNLGYYEYPIRKDEKAKGQDSPRAVLNNDLVLEIRKRYVNESGKQIYKDYKDICSYTTFERALIGKTYTDIPVYKKKQKTWINE